MSGWTLKFKMSDFDGQYSVFTIIRKGDLVKYTVEVFNMHINSGFLVEEERYLGIVISDLIETHGYGMINTISSLGHPITESIDLPYFKVYSLQSSEILYVSFDKIELVNTD